MVKPFLSRKRSIVEQIKMSGGEAFKLEKSFLQAGYKLEKKKYLVVHHFLVV